jgi:AcrR family transcriptional regulator
MTGQPSSTRFPEVPASPRWQSRRTRSHPAPKPMRPENFFHVALDILAESGVEALTTTRLCERLGITKGSFYYHFQNLDDFVAGFADYRESILNGLLDLAAVEDDPLARMSAAVGLIAALPHEAEAAIRAWSHDNPTLNASRERIDKTAIAIAEATAAALVEDAEAAARIGQMLIALVVGIQQIERPVDRERLVRTLAAFAEQATGVEAHLNAVEGELPTVEFRRRTPNPA